MLAKQAVGAIMIGTLFVLLGLMPGPLAGMKREMRNFRDSLSSFPNREPDIQRGPLPGQIWLAVAGGASILIGLLALIL